MKALSKLGMKTPWDIAPAILSALLYLNFLAFLVTLFAATGALLLSPVPSLLSGGLLFLGIVAHLVTRRRSGKLWRRLLLGGIAAGFLIVAFYVLAAVLMTAAWMGVEAG